MKAYGVVGTSQQTIVDDNVKYNLSQKNEVLMKSERPSTDHIAQSDGTWILPQSTIANKTNQIKSKYEQKITELKDALATATLANDTNSIEEIKKEYADLMKKYEAELEGLSNAKTV